MSSNKNFIKTIDNIIKKYNIDYCFVYNNIEFELIENSIYNNTLILVKIFEDIFDYIPPCFKLNAPTALISSYLNDMKNHTNKLFIIDQKYIDDIINVNIGNRYIPILLNKNTYIIENIRIPSNMFFIISSDDIIFNAQYHKITIYNFYLNPSKIQEFKGLIKNGSVSNNGLDKCIVKNIFIDGLIENVILHHGAGWVTHKYFGKNVTTTILNCCSNGNLIEDFTGGICGSNNGHNGDMSINSCYTSGQIIGKYSGGICGNNLGENNGKCLISNCYTLGNIGILHNIKNGQGGICGAYPGYLNGNINIENCYTCGEINSDNSGGIVGQYPGFKSIINIKNCYTTGSTNGKFSGGFMGSNCNISGECNIIDSYSNDNVTSEFHSRANSAKLIGNIGLFNKKFWLSVDNSYPILKIFRNYPWDKNLYNNNKNKSIFI